MHLVISCSPLSSFAYSRVSSSCLLLLSCAVSSWSCLLLLSFIFCLSFSLSHVSRFICCLVQVCPTLLSCVLVLCSSLLLCCHTLVSRSCLTLLSPLSSLSFISCFCLSLSSLDLFAHFRLLLWYFALVSLSCILKKTQFRPPSPPFGMMSTACQIQMILGSACAAIRPSNQGMPHGLLLIL